MKFKIIISLLLLSSLANSQEINDTILRSKKGIPILPAKNDWAIGADVLPFLQLIGNIFYNVPDNETNVIYQTIYSRFMISDNTAIRANFSISNSQTYERVYIQDDAAVFMDPLSRDQTEDSKKTSLSSYGIDLGIMKFRGYGRLKGFYGLHAGYSLYREGYFYSYGNPITSINNTPSSGFGYTAEGARMLEKDLGIVNAISGGLIAGIEYYFLPKICIGGEITLSALYAWQSQGNSKYEWWNGYMTEVYDIAEVPPGTNKISFYTQRPANFTTSLYLMFYF